MEALSSRCTRGKNLQLIRETFVSMNFRNEFTGMNITIMIIMKISFMYICFLSILLNFIKNKLIFQRRVRTISFLGKSKSIRIFHSLLKRRVQKNFEIFPFFQRKIRIYVFPLSNIEIIFLMRVKFNFRQTHARFRLNTNNT